MKVKYYKVEGVYRFATHIISKRIAIHGKYDHNGYLELSDKHYKELKDAGFDLKEMRDDHGRNMFIFPPATPELTDRQIEERSLLRRERVMDEAIATQKTEKELKELRKKEKEEIETSGKKKDQFGPLEGTPEWSKLSSVAKGNVRNKREIHFGYRIVKFKGGIIERSNEKEEENELSLSLEDTNNAKKPKGGTLGDI